MLKKSYLFFILIFLGIFIRFFAIFIYGDVDISNEWGILLNNFNNFGVIGIHVFDGHEVTMKEATENEIVLPSIFMPPFYLFFLIINNLFLKTKLSLFYFTTISQSLFSVFASVFLFKILKKYYSYGISILGFSIYLFFPINIYAATKISSIVLQTSFLIIFYYYFLELISQKNKSSVYLFSIISSILLLLRGEFILIFFFTLFFIFFKTKKIKIVFLSLITTLILISPYLVRNYLTFNEIVITKSFGYNLWKGNNLFSEISGNEEIYDYEMEKNIKDIQANNLYEVNKDKIYKNFALKNISLDPVKYIINYIKKIFAFIFLEIDSTYPNYYNLFHLIPKLLIGVLSTIGALYIFTRKKNNQIYFSLFFLLYVSIFSLFFILPRYELGVLPIQIILACEVIECVFLKLKKFI